MSRPIYRAEVEEWLPEGYVYLWHGPVRYKTQRRSAVVALCPNGHTWRCCLDNIKKGHRCGECADRTATVDEVQSLIREIGYTYIKQEVRGTGKARKTFVWSRCPNGHTWRCRLDNIKKGHRCGECARQRGLSKLHYSLSDFRTGSTDPARPLRVYIYLWAGVVKVGIGRPDGFWERHGATLIHSITVPAIVASAVEEMLLHRLQGHRYGRTSKVTFGCSGAETTEWAPAEAWFSQVTEVHAILDWAERPETAEAFLDNIHNHTIDRFFGRKPPTAPADVVIPTKERAA
jgi:hypothetical protein